MAPRASNRKVAKSLVAMSSAAVFAVYSAGYVRTRPAADHLAERAERRPVAEAAVAPVAVEQGAAPVVVAKVAGPVVVAKVAKVAPAPQASAMEDVAEASVEVEPLPQPLPSPVPPPSPPQPPPPPLPKWKDGTYTGWGTSRHGDIQSQVVIEGGRIISATIAECQTRYSCSVIDKLPPQVSARQSPDVDSVSGATQSADAFYYGVVEALGKAR
jgi:uncharacterized protein with FMN-binding domain